MSIPVSFYQMLVEIIAQGHQIRTFINENLCVDPKGATRGIIAFQLHSGGKTELRFRNLKLELLEPKVQE